jgi:biotin carboxyl carrier protein
MVLEAMKMENPILAPVAGKIVELNVTADSMIESGRALAVIEY